MLGSGGGLIMLGSGWGSHVYMQYIIFFRGGSSSTSAAQRLWLALLEVHDGESQCRGSLLISKVQLEPRIERHMMRIL